MRVSPDSDLLIEYRVASDSKSRSIAYLLWFFLGGLGGHRFYLRRPVTGTAIVALIVGGFLTLGLGIGLIFLLVAVVWLLADAFLIPQMIRRDQDKLRRRLTGSGEAISPPS